ncbi:MAG TPA: peptide deformylase [Candidatus Omnitrophota bacterium]|nr:peptide deformylase [Candidatus Omnitrophota bacterium]HPS37497.1 peptide deformylase [Candidatus Omnitrophota bacterium]
MAKLKICTYPDLVLARKAAPVVDFGPAMQRLFDEMIETMHVSDGVGLAAPQIGISQRIFVACPTMRRGEAFVMVNAVIEKAAGSATMSEGCLSLPGISAEITRATEIKLLYQDRHGKMFRAVLKDFFARVAQHEMDHLNGKLLIDHFTGAKRKELIERYTVLKEQKGM